MEKAEAANIINADPYRRLLYKSIAQLAVEKGASTISQQCLETITEMAQSFLYQVGKSAHKYCEHGGRTIATSADISIALINMGFDVSSLEPFYRRITKESVQVPQQLAQVRPLSLLQVGKKASHPQHMPNHYPSMPDSHSFVRTSTYKQPVTEFEAIREKSSGQIHDVERGLSKYLSKTLQNKNLFPTEDNMYPLIGSKLDNPIYSCALGPCDQVFDFEELEYHYLVANRTEDMPSKEEGEEGYSDTEEMEVDKAKDRPEMNIKPNSSTNKAILDNPNIDNPFLRAAALPKRRKAFNEVPQSQTSSTSETISN